MPRRLAALFGTLSVVFLASAATSMAAVTSFGGPGPGASLFLGAAVAADGTIYVADSTQDRVEHYTGDGAYIADLGAGMTTFDFPTDVAIGSSGAIFVADDDHLRIQKFSATGAYLAQWPVAYSPTQPGLGDLAIASDDTVYVADYRLDRIRRFDGDDGTELPGWGAAGSQPGQFWTPMGVAVAPNGTVYVADTSNDRVQHFTASGQFLGVVGSGLLQPRDVAVAAGGDLLIADAGHNAVVRLSPSGAERARYTFPHAPQSVSPTPSGLVYVTVSEMNANVSDRVYRVDTTTPLARLTASAAEVSTGERVVFDATGSEPPLGSVAHYEWDLDGDGSFEADSGTTPTAATSYALAGTVEPAVRVTSTSAGTAVAKSSVRVHLPSPAGLVGVSINGGVAFTNDPVVDLTVRWPQFTDLVTVANDGGFSNAFVAPVAGHVPWTLDSTGPERLPKTIYVRFGQATQTFQDDIILDQTPPVITEASKKGTDASAIQARSLFAEATRSSVRLAVADDVSGIRNVQFAVDRGAPATPVRFAEQLDVASSPRWVRAQDGAGNWSAWRAITMPGKAARLTIPTQRLSRIARGVKLDVACAEACKIKLRLTVSRRDARRLHLKSTTVATGRAAGLGAGVVHVRARPKSAVARRLAKTSKLKVSVAGTVTTASGPTSVSRSVTLKR